MSRGPDNVIAELLIRETDCPDPELLAEEVMEALEAEDWRIVHKDQVRTRDELMRAAGVGE